VAPLQGGNTAEHLATASLPRSCPECGQHVDRTNIRCPRCRRWFVAPPRRPSRRPLTLVAMLTALVLTGFAAGVALQWFWMPLPPGITVPEEPPAGR